MLPLTRAAWLVNQGPESHKGLGGSPSLAPFFAVLAELPHSAQAAVDAFLGSPWATTAAGGSSTTSTMKATS